MSCFLELEGLPNSLGMRLRELVLFGDPSSELKVLFLFVSSFF